MWSIEATNNTVSIYVCLFVRASRKVTKFSCVFTIVLLEVLLETCSIFMEPEIFAETVNWSEGETAAIFSFRKYPYSHKK